MVKNYFSLAVENLKHRGLRSWLTMFGIFIGIAAVVSLISLSQGLQEAITGQFSTLDPNKLVVTNLETAFGPPGSTVVKKLTSHDVKLIESVRNVDVVVPRLIRVVKVEFNGFLGFDYVADIPNDEKKIEVIYDSLNIEISEGRLLSKEDRGKIVLGYDLAENSENRFGKKIRIGSKVIIQDKEFEVIGILKKAGSFQINSVVLMPTEDLKEVLSIGDEVDIISVQITDKDEVNQAAEDIKKVFRKDRKIKSGEEDDFSVQTPAQALESINTVLNIVNLIVVGIAVISLIIGSAGIANTVYTSVLERRKEIGTMKAVGAKNIDILKIFMIESGLLGLIGGIIGVILGWVVSKSIEWIAINQLGTTLLKAATPAYLIIGSLFFAFVIGAASGTLPALQASKLKPIDALRYE